MTPPFQPAFSESVPPSGGGSVEIRRPPLHPLEIALVGVTALHLCFLPWALGAMHPWSQLTSLGFACVGFFLALLPRKPANDDRKSLPSRGGSANRFLGQPAFWAGLLFLCYIAIQGLNPAWRFFSNDDSWWLEPLPHVAWLPSGVDAPFERANPWRTLVILGSLALLVASVWAGFSRRKSYYALFTLLATNAGLLALFGLLQHLTGATRIYWTYVASNDGFAATFIYPNHAGPYLYLMTALSIALARWHDQRARHRQEEPGRSFIFVFLAACCGLMVIYSYSRMSIILLLAFTGWLGAELMLKFLRRTGPIRDRLEFRPLALTMAAFLSIGLVTLRTEAARDRFAEMLTNPSEVRAHTLARNAAIDMLRDHWICGWGAGCFRYGFSKYTPAYPEIHYFPNGVRRTWEHAHDDLIEFPVEYGLVGLLPLVTVLGIAVWQLYHRRFWQNVVSFSIVSGCTLVLLHSWVDFVFQNPAILLTWSVLIAGALRWAELDRPRSRAPSANRPN